MILNHYYFSALYVYIFKLLSLAVYATTEKTGFCMMFFNVFVSFKSFMLTTAAMTL